MSFSIDQITAAMQSMHGNQPGAKNVSSDEALQMQAVFGKQMQMAQSFLGESGFAGSASAMQGGFNDSIMNDALMFDALSSLAHIMQSGKGNVRPLKAINTYTAAVPHEIRQAVSAVEPEIKEVLGSMSAVFESGKKGIEAIGYDRVGGTSYGKYQISSKAGTMDAFLEYLEGHNPIWARRLQGAGPANTGSINGEMPKVWKDIAQEEPQSFEAAQRNFIRQQNYDPARRLILSKTGVDIDNAPQVVQEVLWSTAVQHGATGASRIFGKVIDSFEAINKADFNKHLVEGVYERRKGQFGSSSARVQASVESRLNTEKQMAMNMLQKSSLNTMV